MSGEESQIKTARYAGETVDSKNHRSRSDRGKPKLKLARGG
jgi:hypothetical protein